jgi:Xaa-Pro aminopeptidase
VNCGEKMMNQVANEIDQKTERLTRLLAERNLGGVLLTLQPNFSWLTGGRRNGIDTSREVGAGALLVRNDGKRFVLANRIEIPRLLDEELAAKDFEPIEFPWEAEKSRGSFLADQAQELLNGNLGLGSDRYLNGHVEIESDISACRYQLTTHEIQRYKSLGRDAGEVLGNVMKTLGPGETEKAVANRVANALATRDIHSVVLLVAGDERIGKYRHPVPTDLSWKKSLMVVVCARRHGLIASLTRLIHVGSVPADLSRRTHAAAQVNARLFASTRRGTSGAELYNVVAKAYAEAGFPGEEQLHHQGGACGYRTRDWVAHPASTDRVEVDQAFAWNPSVTGTKVEETCIAFANGIQVITSSPDWPLISIELEGQNFSLPDVLSI